MSYDRWHGRTTAILHFSLVLWCCCSPCRGKGYKIPDDCDPPRSERPKSFLWTVRRNPPSYFFGTIHVPYSRVWDYIPENTKRAFEVAENIFFELDLTDPYTISALSNCQLLPHGKRLIDVLPFDIYIRLKHHLEYVKYMMPSWLTSDQRSHGLYADYLFNAITGNWERKRPVWVMLLVNSLTESDIKSRGIPVLDLYLAQQAEKMNKPSGAVEKVEEQCVPLNGLNLSQVLFALNQTLQQLESIRAGENQVVYTTDDLIKHYNCGDLNAVIFNKDASQVPNLMNVSLQPGHQMTARRIDEYFREELIYKRNKRMGQRVMQLLLTHPEKSFFFAFGAGHFLGNNTVLDVLRNAGFVVDNVPNDEKIKSSRKKSRLVSSSPPLVPEFRALRDFTVAGAASSNSMTDDEQQQQTSQRMYVLPPNNNHRKNRKKLLPQRTTASSTSGFTASVPAPSRKHRNFNDLWVRLDPATTSSSRHLPPLPPGDDELIVQNSLRIWYGLPPNSAAAPSSIRTTATVMPYSAVLLAVMTSSLFYAASYVPAA